MGKTSIEWTDRSVNPFRARNRVTGKVGWHCVHHGPGCLHCYSERTNKWVGTGLPFLKPSGEQVELFFDERPLEALARIKKPQKVFPCDMTDVFLEAYPDEWIDRLVRAMADMHWHTFQVLTKRAERMAEYISKRWDSFHENPVWHPLKNIWWGVSVEDQKHGLPRVDAIREMPAAVRFLSIEPLLEDLGEIDLTGISWVIVGGESGPKARPMHPDWARSVRDQCVAAGVPFFFKQWGEWYPGGAPVGTRMDWVHASGLHYGAGEHIRGDRTPVESMARLGKRAAGRMLDGRTWDQFPQPLAASTKEA